MFTQQSRQRKIIQKNGRLLLTLSALFMLLLPIACSSPPPGNPANGKRWYSLYRCNGCHGQEGTGGRAVELAGLHTSYSAFLRKLRNSGSSIMPSFPVEKLSDQDAADIYLWLRDKSNDQHQVSE